MPSFQDSALIFFIALLLFGPKKLPELARQLGKLMGEFRRASNEFRMQMEDELRASEQAEQQKKIAAMEAAAPVMPAITDGTENTIAPPITEEPLHPHMQPYDDNEYATDEYPTGATSEYAEPAAESVPEPLPIASSGDLDLMPPSTGLPVANSSVSQAFTSIPRAPEPDIAAEATPETAQNHTATEASLHG